jgi:hypothetical protein
LRGPVHYNEETDMTTNHIVRTVTGWSLILAPATGLIAAIALPALPDTRSAEITVIAAHQDRFYLYALAMLISSYLLIPAFFGIMNLLRDASPRWAYLAGGLAQLGLIIAVGDAATELMYWQMGDPSADHAQMTALANRYEDAIGSALIYNIGGLAVLAGTLLLAVSLWRTRVVPRWSAAGVAVSLLANLAAFTVANQPLLIASYLIMLAALGRIALTVLATPAPHSTDTAHPAQPRPAPIPR